MTIEKDGEHANKKNAPEQDDLRTESPISEKDEVKAAEERLKKNADTSVAADLKNRKHTTDQGSI